MDNKVDTLSGVFDNFVEDHTPVYFSAVGSGNSSAINSSRQYSSFSTFNFDIVENEIETLDIYFVPIKPI